MQISIHANEIVLLTLFLGYYLNCMWIFLISQIPCVFMTAVLYERMLHF